MTFLQAIAKEEGYGIQGTRATRNNNPGDLEYSAWMEEFNARLETPQAGETARFAAFPTPQHGWACLWRLMTFPAYRGKTVHQALNMFAPSNENDTSAYEASVCASCGCRPSDIVDGLLCF